MRSVEHERNAVCIWQTKLIIWNHYRNNIIHMNDTSGFPYACTCMRVRYRIVFAIPLNAVHTFIMEVLVTHISGHS